MALENYVFAGVKNLCQNCYSARRQRWKNMTPEFDYDLITLGAGSGGLSIIERAASYGQHCAVIERGDIGGTSQAADLHNSGTKDGIRITIPSHFVGNEFDEATGQLPKMRRKTTRRKAKAKTRTVRKDPLYVDGERPRPTYVDYKDVELLKKLVNRHGRIVGRRKTGCTAISQHAVTESIKRARFMALLPFKGD